MNFKAYTVSPADGSTRIVLVNSDAGSSVNASIDIGAAVAAAGAVYLRGPSLTSITGVTLAYPPTIIRSLTTNAVLTGANALDPRLCADHRHLRGRAVQERRAYRGRGR